MKICGKFQPTSFQSVGSLKVPKPKAPLSMLLLLCWPRCEYICALDREQVTVIACFHHTRGQLIFTLWATVWTGSYIYIYIYAFSRRFYPKRLTLHSGYTCFISMCVPWESNPQPFALLTQCSTTEPQEHRVLVFCSPLFTRIIIFRTKE